MEDKTAVDVLDGATPVTARYPVNAEHTLRNAVSALRHEGHHMLANELEAVRATTASLLVLFAQARREYGAFGSLSGETLVQIDAAISRASR